MAAPNPPFQADERATLVAFLDYNREVMIDKLGGLTDEQLVLQETARRFAAFRPLDSARRRSRRFACPTGTKSAALAVRCTEEGDSFGRALDSLLMLRGLDRPERERVAAEVEARLEDVPLDGIGVDSLCLFEQEDATAPFAPTARFPLG